MQKTANPNATAAAQELLNYLSDIEGMRIITGQHTQTNEMEEIQYIRHITDKEPKLCGFELLSYSPNINYEDASEECLQEVYENRGTVETAIRWAKTSGGIITLTFHWFSPIGGHDKSFYAKNTDFDAEQVLIPGTPERAAFYRDMDVIAQELRKFQEENLPVLWRPLHEAQGDWFWWGAKGPVVASKLYRLMYDYYVNELHLDHLLWVWNCPVAEAYPGDDCVDVVSVDVYPKEGAVTDYAFEYGNLIDRTSKSKVAALAEVGILPDVDLLVKWRVPWVYYMTWSKEYCIGEKHNLKSCFMQMYKSPYSITR